METATELPTDIEKRLAFFGELLLDFYKEKSLTSHIKAKYEDPQTKEVFELEFKKVNS